MRKEVDELSVSLEKMEIKGGVDLDSSLPIIKDLAIDLISFRENLISSDMPPQKIFQLYYPSFVVSVVLQNMKDRLKEAKKLHDNPIVALHALKVMPFLKEVVTQLESDKKDSNLISKATDLQSNATKNNLFKLDQNRVKVADKLLQEIAEDIKILHQNEQ